MAAVAPDHTSLVPPRGRKRRETGKPEGKRFVCSNEGCGRSFTRAEHLQRHLLNHSTGEYTCERCRAHFKRRDLLGKNTGSVSFFFLLLFHLHTDATMIHVLLNYVDTLRVLCLSSRSNLVRSCRSMSVKLRSSHTKRPSCFIPRPDYILAVYRHVPHYIRISHCRHVRIICANKHMQIAI